MKVFISLLLLITLYSCLSINKKVQFQIENNYVGPRIVFSKPNIKINEGNLVLVKDGLGCINKKIFQNEFVFKQSSNNNLEIIPIGDEDFADSVKHNVFQLTQGNVSSNCLAGELNLITFFIGRKSDFFLWREKYNSEIDYFDSTGANWCKYYQSCQ